VADFAALFPEEQVDGLIDVARDVGIIRDPAFPEDKSAFYRDMCENGALRYVAGVSPTPLLLVHGELDEMVPPSSSGALYRNAGEPRELVIMPGAEHRLRRDPGTTGILADWASKFQV